MAKKKKVSYKSKGLKKGYAVNWSARIIYKTGKMPKKGKDFKAW